MRIPCFTGCALTLLVSLLAGGYCPAAQAGPLGGAAGEQPPTPGQEQPEVLTRGPVHEAFAEPINLEVQAGLVAPSAPPPIIQETPPTERPRGDRFLWVPGYWSWDGDRSNYVWVSACWRVAPPNMYWVPGYWSRVPGGWEWVAGFWTPAGVQEIEYLPAPPAVDNVQAPGPPPSADKTWVPSCWYWYQGKYVPRAGYWLTAQPDWVWVPSHYVWTPRGYVFCDGHWDYPLETRGVLFAPVYFPPSVYGRAGFSYSPSIVVDLDGLSANLFTYPRYSHYYFGDYYDDAYLRVGIYPRFEGDRIHTWYDPIYEYDRWRHRRTDPRWEEQQRQEYDRRHDDKQLRPARTYREQETRLARLPESQRRPLEVAQLLTTVVARKTMPVKFEKIKAAARNTIAQQARDVQKFQEDRNRWEVTPAVRKAGQTAAEHKGAMTPPTERREIAPSPAEHSPPGQRAEHKEAGTSATERRAAFVPPREVPLTLPERVKIPGSPIIDRQGRPGFLKKGPPDRPVDEQAKTEAKNARKDDREHKDKGEDKDNRSN